MACIKKTSLSMAFLMTALSLGCVLGNSAHAEDPQQRRLVSTSDVTEAGLKAMEFGLPTTIVSLATSIGLNEYAEHLYSRSGTHYGRYYYNQLINPEKAKLEFAQSAKLGRASQMVRRGAIGSMITLGTSGVLTVAGLGAIVEPKAISDQISKTLQPIHRSAAEARSESEQQSGLPLQ